MGMLSTFCTIIAQQDMIYLGRRAARRDSAAQTQTSARCLVTVAQILQIVRRDGKMERVQCIAVLLRCIRMGEIVTLGMATIGMEDLPFSQVEAFSVYLLI